MTIKSSNIITAAVNVVQPVPGDDEREREPYATSACGLMPGDDEREREPYATSACGLKLLVYAALTLVQPVPGDDEREREP